MLRWLICSVVVAAFWLQAPYAAASCLGPSVKLFWSYPADGQMDVPVNADLWFNGTLLGAPELDGRQLASNGQGGFDLGALGPNTRHEITWGTNAAPIVVRFTTGGPVVMPPSAALTPRMPANIERDLVGQPWCPLVPDQGCFDTGPPKRVRFDVGQPPVAYIVKKRLCDGSVSTFIWPVSCGAPILDDDLPVICAEVAMTDGTTVGSFTPLYCSAPDLPPGITLPMRSGCSSDWPPAAATVVMPPRAAVSTMESVVADPTPVTTAAMTQAAAGAAAPTQAHPAAANGCSLDPRGHSPGSAHWLGLGLLIGVIVRRRFTAS